MAVVITACIGAASVLAFELRADGGVKGGNMIQDSSAPDQQPTVTIPEGDSGVAFTSLAAAQEQVAFELEEPEFVPSGLRLDRIAFFGPGFVPPEYRQQLLQDIKSGVTKLGFIEIAFTGQNRYLSLEQGYMGSYSLEGLPESAHGTVTLKDGALGIWIRGGWVGGDPAQGAGRYDPNVSTRLEWGADIPNEPGVRYHLYAKGAIGVEELIQVANSLRPIR